MSVVHQGITGHRLIWSNCPYTPLRKAIAACARSLLQCIAAADSNSNMIGYLLTEMFVNTLIQ